MKLTKIFIVFTFLLTFSSCSSKISQLPVIYLIPERFEGAIVVFYNQKNGGTPVLTEKGYVLTIPNDGILKINADKKMLSGKPAFFLVNETGSRKELEYLYTSKLESQGKGRTENDVSANEKENQVFAMNYDNFNFNTRDDRIYGKSFLVYKIKDGNLFASRDLNHKITDFQKNFPR